MSCIDSDQESTISKMSSARNFNFWFNQKQLKEHQSLMSQASRQMYLKKAGQQSMLSTKEIVSPYASP